MRFGRSAKVFSGHKRTASETGFLSMAGLRAIDYDSCYTWPWPRPMPVATATASLKTYLGEPMAYLWPIQYLS